MFQAFKGVPLFSDKYEQCIHWTCLQDVHPPSQFRDEGVLGDFEHLSAATSHCILCHALYPLPSTVSSTRFSPRCFSRLPPPQLDISGSTGVATEFAIQGDPELQTPSKETALQERRSGSRGREGHRRSLPREPHIFQDTARHVGRDSLPFVNCWKLVVWILLWRNKLGRNEAWHLPNFTASHLHVTPNVL